MHAHILLDGSSSMAQRWGESLDAINLFAKELAEKTPDAKIHLHVFRGKPGKMGQHGDFVTVAKATARKWVDIIPEDVPFGGMTPLFDAIGTLHNEIGRRKKKTSITIITDGHENASKEVTRHGARAIIKNFEERNFDVVFIGSNFGEVYDQAQALGTSAGKTINTGTKGMAKTMSVRARNTQHYEATGQSLDWTPEDKEVENE